MSNSRRRLRAAMKRRKHLESHAAEVLRQRRIRAIRKRFYEVGRSFRQAWGMFKGTDKRRREREFWSSLALKEAAVGFFNDVQFFTSYDEDAARVTYSEGAYSPIADRGRTVKLRLSSTYGVVRSAHREGFDITDVVDGVEEIDES